MKDVKQEREKKRGIFARIFSIFRSNKDDEIDLLSEQINDAGLPKRAPRRMVPDDVYFEEEETQSVTDIPKPKRMIPVEHVFVKKIDAKKYCDDLYIYMQDNGLSVHRNNLREMFATLAASKLIIVKHEDSAITERFIELFADFVGANYYRDFVKSSLESFDSLLDDRYQLTHAILDAQEDENRIHLMSLRNVNLDSLERYFDKILEFSWNPRLTCLLAGDDQEGYVEMPNNIWFMVSPSEVDDAYMSENLAKSAIILELNAKLVDPKEEVEENGKKISYEYLLNLFEEAYDQYYIEETEWKKIDKVEQYLKENSMFVLDNRLFRQMERYTSIFLLFGGDKNEAMDNVLYVKLLQAISVVKINANQDSESGLFQLFEKLFGLENLAKAKLILKDIQEKQ